MSASNQKMSRDELRISKQDKKLNAAAEQAKKDKKYKRNSIIAAIIVVIVIAAAFFINSNLLYTKTTAVQIGDTKYSAAEVNCYYEMAFNSIYNEYYQTYGDYVQYFLDTSTPLNEQQYSEEQTWADFIYETALDNMTQITVLYNEAKKNGYQLSAEELADIDATMETMGTYATSYGYDNLNAFLVANYGGKGMNEQLYRDILTKITIADSYSAQLQDSYTYTEDELKAYYAENADLYDTFSYEFFYVGTGDDAFAELEDDAKVTAAHDAAAEIAKATTADEFGAAVIAYAGEDHVASVSTTQGLSLSTLFSEWLCDDARKAGDSTVVDTDTGSYALLFLSRDNNEYALVDMRHILISAEADEEGTYTDEALAAAKATAEDVYAQWQTDPTEDNFIALAAQYSQDQGSAAYGGLYENVYRNAMVSEIDEFLFDSGSQPGDTALVYGNNGSYAGYHIVYYVGEGELYCDALADAGMRSEEYAAYFESASAGYDVTEGAGMKFVEAK